MIRLIRSELLKLRTTHMWWIFLLCSLAFTGIALLLNTAQADDQLHNAYYGGPGQDGGEVTPEQIQQEEAKQLALAHSSAALARSAANIYTSGQFFGLLMVMLMAILLITNEFYHQTATATFLATPKRTKVIIAKLITASLMAVGFWLISTAISVLVGVIFFSAEGVGNSLGNWAAQQAVLLNLLVYALWGIFGIGIGVLLRSQIGATITAAVVYTIGTYAALIALALIREYLIKDDWVLETAIYIPPLASQHVVGTLAGQMGDTPLPARWVGAVVLIGWAVLLGTIGTLIMRKRDIA
jgi:ABC-2 type transport system permease protein